jgi:transposase
VGQRIIGVVKLAALGHEVVRLPPQYVKPYVKRNKNDAADAAAICEAISRPTMRFVPVKTVVQQAALMLAGMRDALNRDSSARVLAMRKLSSRSPICRSRWLRSIK